MTAVSPRLEDYVRAIYTPIEEGKVALVADVARMLSVKMPSVVQAVRELKRLELVTQEPYANIELTAKGLRLARRVHARHKLLRTHLVRLGVSRKTADRDACLIGHVLSAETIEKIRIHTEQRQ